ncbi:MAG: ribosome maturation factor RimM [Candidatus Obscuribacterales bacterium]|nr:ribosome maturation factor RimM [Candidatus Obscuribacterales bacterium]
MSPAKRTSTTDNTTEIEPYDFLVGEVVGFRGLKGEIKIRPGTNSPDLLLFIETVEIEKGGKSRERVGVKQVRLDKRNLYIELADHNDRNSVEALKGASLYCQPGQLAPLLEQEWWVDDLVGLQAYSTNGDHLGAICDVYGEHGEFLEIELKANNKRVLVPFVKALVPVVDLELKRIEIESLPGLLE